MSASEREVDLGSQVDVSPSVLSMKAGSHADLNVLTLQVLQELVQLQRQQLELTREMVAVNREVRQRQHQELEAWQRENEGIVERCRDVLGTLSNIHAGMLGDMADYVGENAENLLESDYSISDFVDRFGPRMHHLSAMLGVFKQLTGQTASQASGKRG